MLAASRHLLRWPLPALLAWGLSWAVFAALAALGAPPWAALLLAGLLGLGLSLTQSGRWRRLMLALGFPLSLLLSGWALPAWAWLLPLALLALAYPHRSWSDAPLYPTPRGALQALATLAPLPAGARILDAGCGLGHGLAELHRAYPLARLEGIEWSRPLAWLARRRCAFATVRRGDMWAQRWQGLAMVYLFQRPESMERAWCKARAEMAPGSWLASLDFAVAGQGAQHCLQLGRRHRLWLYKI